MFSYNYFYVIVCDNKTIDRVYCLTLGVIDSCKELAKQGHRVSIRKYKVPS